MIIWKQAPVVQKLDNAIHRRSLSTGKRKFIINNNYKFGGGGGWGTILMIIWKQAPLVQKLDNAIHRINHYTLIAQLVSLTLIRRIVI